ncbi:MAG: hypothetical protein KDA24_24895 [Deltaproteobacteria bacterium]|nr:hypothetical protein [Deltaproteobacteria bacterium]
MSRMALLLALLLLPGIALSAEPTPAAEGPASTEAPADAPKPLPPPKLYYKGGFFLESPDGAFKLKINGRMQARLVWENEPGTDGRRENSGQFSVVRARIKMKGSLWSGLAELVLHIDFAKGTFEPKDVTADFRLVKDHLYLHVGQFKKPFDRQFILSSSKMQFVERGITEEYFRAGRDLGVMLHNNYEKAKPVAWAIALVNGSSEKDQLSGGVAVDLATGEGSITGGKFTNVPGKPKPMVVSRVDFIFGDLNAYAQSEPGKTKKGFAVGASAQWTGNVDREGDGAVRGVVDWMGRVNWFSASGGFWLASKQDGDLWRDQVFDAWAAQAQVGAILGGVVEPAARYAYIGRAGSGNDLQEILGSVGVFIKGHKLKVVTDAGAILEETATGMDVSYRVRSNLEIGF